MRRTVAARFTSEAEAEHALSVIGSEVALLDSAVLTSGLSGTLALDSLELTPEERSASEALLQRGGFLLIAQASSDAGAEAVLRILESMREASEPQTVGGDDPSPATSSTDVPVEERIPMVEEELRIGKREVLRGGARVHSFTTEVPVQERVELLEEEIRLERRPVGRRLTDEELAEGGLLQERVFEVTQMREEAVVSKEAFVREELVVSKNVEHRLQEINETVRRTVVETEQFQADGPSAFSSFRAGDRRPGSPEEPGQAPKP
ncbi:MAG: YsnF/AvaK domain-containing protein [Pseudomonadota bacterium]|nr:YsnF/AvaK domain-containing protein [Pseudomonadota bacterium]